MTTPRKQRLPLVLSGLALVIAVAGTGGPVVARAFDASNADKVDGKHAVGAGAPLAKRKGKLVAAGTNGYLPNNAIKKVRDADRVDGIDSRELLLPSVVPPGRTIYGRFGLDGDSDGTGDWGTTVSFPVPLPEAPESIEYVVGEPSANCSGSAANPAAAPGYLCIYQSNRIGLGASAPTGMGVNRFGFYVILADDAVPGDAFAIGTWATTAPTS